MLSWLILVIKLSWPRFTCEGSLVEELPRVALLWTCLWGTVLIASGIYRRTEPTFSVEVVLGCVRRLAKQEPLRE